MDIKHKFEKDSGDLFKHNLLKDSMEFHVHPKIENIQWSVANDHLRASGNTEHYAIINDTRHEDSNHNGSTVNDTTSQKIENQYLSLNSGDGLPIDLSNGIAYEIYSYATTGDPQGLDFRDQQYLDNGGDTDEKKNTNGDEYLSQTNLNHYDNRKFTTARENHCSASHVPTSPCLDISGIKRVDTYLVPRQNIPKEKQQKPVDIRDIDCHEYDHPDDHTSNGHISNGSLYVENVRIPQIPSRSPDTSNVKNVKRCRGRKIIILVIVLLLLVAATATAVAVTMFNKPEGCEIDGSCQAACTKYLDVPNGQVNSTTDFSPSPAIRITCNQGFSISGNKTAICLDSGEWSSVSKCERVDCGNYTPPRHVRMLEVDQKTTFNTSLNLLCETGFVFSQNSDDFVWCNESGNWSGSPQCETLVNLYVEPSLLLIGENGKLTCEFRETPNWRKIDFKRISSNNDSVTMVTIENKVDSYKPSFFGDHIEIIEDKFTHDSGRVVVTFKPVQCTEAFELPGDIKFTCDVHSGDSVIFHDERLIRIQGLSTAPVLTISPHVVVGEDTKTILFVCDMLFAEPDGIIIIESDINGVFNTLLSSANGEYRTDLGWIQDIDKTVENCWYRTVVWFGLKSVTMKWHRKQMRCIAKPSDDSVNRTVLTSGIGVVKVMSENFCQGQSVLVYPYNCGLYVLCDEEDNYNSIKEVQTCGSGNCYNGDTCSQCSIEGGCSITDMYFKDGDSSVVGAALTIVCVVERFTSLKDIKITRNNGELVSSIQTGDNINGFRTLSKLTYLNVTSGIIALHVDQLLCNDEGVYRCTPEGGGKHSDDVIDLNMNCPQ